MTGERLSAVMNLFVAILVVISVGLIEHANGHGMVISPVNRASRWRYDSTATADYDDSQGFCGGFYKQWYVHGGQCGMCGDEYSDARPRAHEHGGRYGTGKIVGTYSKGSIINVSVMLTANHMGFFKFHLCRMDGASESESCFNQYPLALSSGGYQYTLTSSAVGTYVVALRLPSITCNHCVLRWTYNVGNSWGTCADGSGAMGCGAQENFRTCSDIKLV